MSPKNNKGISVINNCAKLNDLICSKLKKWFRSYGKQTVAQEKRRYMEHIVTLRILEEKITVLCYICEL